MRCALVLLGALLATSSAAAQLPTTVCDGRTVRRMTVRGADAAELGPIALQPGTTCTDAVVNAEARRIWDLGRFDDVTVDGEPVGGASVDLVLRVHVRPPTPVAPTPDDPLADPGDAYRGEVGVEVALGVSQSRAAAGMLGPGGVILPDVPGSLSVDALAVVISERLRVTPELELQFALPTVPYSPTHDDGSHRASGGNPFVGAAWVHEWRRARIRLGGGLTIPAAPLDAHAQDGGLSVHGGEEPWLWASRQMAFLGVASLETRALPIYASLELAGAGLAPLDDRVAGPRAVLSARGAVAWRPLAQLQVGTRMAVVWSAYDAIGTLTATNFTTLSVTPYVRADFGRAFVDLGLTLNLTTPYGTAFDAGAIWAVRLAGGVRF